MKIARTSLTVCSVLLLLWWSMLHADDISGGNGNDNLPGTNEMDTIRGRGGDDTISGMGGNDRIQGDDGDDTIDGGPGEDVIQGGIGVDTITGGAGMDNIRGGPDNDTIDGGTENDRIRGGDGDDTIDGGPGNDRILGGPGLDTYTVRANDGNDRVVIRSGDIGAGQTELVKCGSGNDTVKFIGILPSDQIPNTRQFQDPETGGLYDIDADCEDRNIKFNDDLAFLDSMPTPSTTAGVAATHVTITGQGFPPSAAIVTSLGPVAVAQFETDDGGAFSTTFKVPDLAPGMYRLSFTNAGLDFEDGLFFTVVGQPSALGWPTILVAIAALLAGLLIGFALFRRRRNPA